MERGIRRGKEHFQKEETNSFNLNYFHYSLRLQTQSFWVSYIKLTFWFHIGLTAV